VISYLKLNKETILKIVSKVQKDNVQQYTPKEIVYIHYLNNLYNIKY